MEKYYTLCTLEADGIWYPQFGDYDRDVVEGEREEYGGQKVCILCTGPSQCEVYEAVAGLNMNPLA